MNFNATLIIKQELIFQEFYSFNTFQAFGLLVSFINIFLITSLLLLIIWYEQYGSNHNRTLINQFVTSTCWSGVAYNLLAQVPEVAIGLFGPFNQNFCLFHSILKNTILSQLVVLLTGISVVKYIYIFITKNPSCRSDDFICFFTNLACCFNSFIYQGVLHLMPGNNSHPFYYCSGTLPGIISVSICKNFKFSF